MKKIKDIMLITVGTIAMATLLLYLLVGAVLQESYNLSPLTQEEIQGLE